MKIGVEQGREYESRVPCDVMIGSQSDCEMMGASLYTDESVPIPVTTGSVHHRKIQQITLLGGVAGCQLLVLVILVIIQPSRYNPADVWTR